MVMTKKEKSNNDKEKGKFDKKGYEGEVGQLLQEKTKIEHEADEV